MRNRCDICIGAVRDTDSLTGLPFCSKKELASNAESKEEHYRKCRQVRKFILSFLSHGDSCINQSIKQNKTKMMKWIKGKTGKGRAPSFSSFLAHS